MELDWLDDFLALSELRNFSRAAERRHLSQPAFSRRIRLLETWVGASLVNRDTHRVVLTPAGEQWKMTAEEALRRLNLGRAHAQEIAEGASASIRFASTHALSMTFFPEWLEGIEGELPERSSVSLVTDNMAGCEQLMMQGQAQILLCHHHPASPTVLASAHFLALDIGEDVLMPVTSVRANGEVRHSLPGSDGNPVPHLAYSDVSGMGRILASTQAAEGPSAHLAPIFTAHVATVLLTMARAGRGVAWLPRSLVQADLAEGRLTEAGGPEWRIPITVRLYRPRLRQNAATEALWAAVKRR